MPNQSKLINQTRDPGYGFNCVKQNFFNIFFNIK
jgi:hypothetical protein